MGGKIAQLGQRLIEGAAKSLADDFFKRFENALISELDTKANQSIATVDGANSDSPNPDEPLYLESNPFARKALYGITFAVAVLLIYFWVTLK